MKNSWLYNADCLAHMESMADETVDLVLTDPPYGIKFNSNYRKKSSLGTIKGILNDGVDNLPFLESVATDLYRVLKTDRHLYWFTRWDKVDQQKPMLERVGFTIKNNLIWVKNNWSMGDLTGAYAAQYECILFAQKGRRSLFEVDGRKRHTDVLYYDRISPNKLLHSHQKPTDLLEFLIRKSTVEGETVFDPFMGAASAAVAAENTARRFVGCELSTEIYSIASRRVNREKEVDAA